MQPSSKPPVSDEQIAALQARNAARSRAAIAALGERYAHHPKNHVPRRMPFPLPSAGGGLC